MTDKEIAESISKSTEAIIKLNNEIEAMKSEALEFGLEHYELPQYKDKLKSVLYSRELMKTHTTDVTSLDKLTSEYLENWFIHQSYEFLLSALKVMNK